MNRECAKAPNFSFRKQVPDGIELGKDLNEFVPYSKNLGNTEKDRLEWQ